LPVRILEDDVINRIAAGEVVERPASAVKELLENAIDAGATTIRLELEDGGRGLARVTDDGCGMDRQDTLLSIERHATSKIQSDADLLDVATLGFRGEALPSIASVSRFELRSRTANNPEGTRLFIEGGHLRTVEACGCPAGTDVSVRDLFWNVRPRLAFLKSARTEHGHCFETLVRIALMRPEIDFELVADGKSVLRAPRAQNLARRAASLLGPYAEALRPIAFERGPIAVRGLVSPVGVHRDVASASSYFYVNGRFVKDGVLKRAIQKAYQGLVPVGRAPVVVLDLRLQPGLVDVNVHPTKTEVRFREVYAVEGAVSAGVRELLRDLGIHKPLLQSGHAPASSGIHAGGSAQPVLPLRSQEGPLFSAEARSTPPAWSFEGPVEEAPREQAPVALDSPPPARDFLPAQATLPAQVPDPPAAPSTGALLPVARWTDLRVIGQHADSYVVCEGGGELVIIDQHAAHERVMLERLSEMARGQGIPSQVLLVPIVVELSPARALAFEAHLDLLSQLGLEVSAFGGSSFAIRGVPSNLLGFDPVALVQDLADDLTSDRGVRSIEAITELLLSRLACHSAVRAHQPLSLFEMRGLLESLDHVDFGVCAHGRPVAVRLGAHELETRFHRT
jgi:DNA mismatch repair protein MutL